MTDATRTRGGVGEAESGLPRPAVCFADHSYPAFSARQMVEYAEATNAAALARVRELEEGLRWMTNLYLIQMRYVPESDRVTEITARGEDRSAESIIAKARSLLPLPEPPAKEPKA